MRADIVKNRTLENMRAESPTVERNGKIAGNDIMGWKGRWLAIRDYIQVYVGVAELFA